VTDLTVDVGVLMSGSGLGDRSNYAASARLMNDMVQLIPAVLVIDNRGIIRAQYAEKMVQGTLGHQWVQRMASMGKIVLVSWGRFNKGARTKLKEAHFDPEDFKYVRTACETQSKRLVSHDTHDYSDHVCQILRRRLNVRVCGAAEACELLASSD